MRRRLKCGDPGSGGGEQATGELLLGTLRQGLLTVPGVPGLPDAYGSDGDANRCWTDNGAFDWTDAACWVPSSKSGWKVYVPTAASPKGCTNATVRSAIKNAALSYVIYLNNNGWSLSVVEGAEVAGDKRFAITQVIAGSNGGLLIGGTTVPTSCSSGDMGYCENTS